jgi:hypothetical protein
MVVKIQVEDFWVVLQYNTSISEDLVASIFTTQKISASIIT